MPASGAISASRRRIARKRRPLRPRCGAWPCVDSAGDPSGHRLEPCGAGGAARRHRRADGAGGLARQGVGVRAARRRRVRARRRAGLQGAARVAPAAEPAAVARAGPLGVLAAALVAATLASGWAWASGATPRAVGYNLLNLHVVLGVVLALGVLAHALLRARRPRRADIADRRQFLVAAAIAGGRCWRGRSSAPSSARWGGAGRSGASPAPIPRRASPRPRGWPIGRVRWATPTG